MRVLRSLGALLLLCVAVGCGTTEEGGVVGTGISASITGNVSSVDANGTAAVAVLQTQGGPRPEVLVGLDEVPELREPLDEDGRFTLEGEFAGTLHVRFTVVGRFSVALPVEVPAGADVELSDIVLARREARPREVRQRRFFGRLVQVNCEVGFIVFDDDISRRFRIRLLPATEIRIGDEDTPGACTDLRRGDRAVVESRLDATGLGAVRIVTRPLPNRPR